MNKKTNLAKISAMSIGILSAVFLISAIAQNTYASIGQTELGSKGDDVTQLQQFLASNYLIYPSGLVTGYYGSLTEAAVKQFQLNYDISTTGNVGPQTQNQINNITLSGNGLDISSAVIGNVSVQTTRSDATVYASTNEVTHLQVYYATTPLSASEASLMHAEQPYISGSSVANNSSGTTQTVSITNLQPNTLYYYIIRSIDNSGNVSMTTQSTFQTLN